jgi:hypothetical protein
MEKFVFQKFKDLVSIGAATGSFVPVNQSQAIMSRNEVRTMAVKKSSKAKKRSAPKTKSAIKKAAPKKSVKKASRVKAKPAVNAAAAKKVVKKAAPVSAKKAAPLKLSDSQQKLLSTISQCPSPGYLGNKAAMKALTSLLAKKVVKTGKKEGAFFRYTVTKLGEKSISKAAPAPASTPVPPPPSVETTPAPTAAAAPVPPPTAPAAPATPVS